MLLKNFANPDSWRNNVMALLHALTVMFSYMTAEICKQCGIPLLLCSILLYKVGHL
jgi:uncharacterized Zn finger protein (UPF0148 family)